MNKKMIMAVVLVFALGAIVLRTRNLNRGVGGLDALSKTYPELLECDKLEGPYLVGDCLRQKAVSLNEPRICSLMTSPVETYECLRDVALEVNDAGVCSGILNQTYQDGCFYAVAVDVRNASICQSIQSNASRVRCLAKTTVDVEACSDIENQDGRDWCVKKLSIETYTSELCARIVNPAIRDACYFEYVEKNTLAAANCKKIADAPLQEKCWEKATILECPVKDFQPKYGKPL